MIPATPWFAAPAGVVAVRAASAPLRWRRDLDTPGAAHLAWTPDGRLLAYMPVEAPGVVTFVDPAGTGAPSFSLGARPGPLGLDPPVRGPAFALSPDGRRLAIPAAGGVVKLWDLKTRAVERELGPAGEEVGAVAFDPLGRWLASGGRAYGLALWDLGTGKLLKRRNQPDREGAGQTALVFSRDGRWLVGAGADRELTLWRAPSLEVTSAVEAHPTAAFATDGRAVAYHDRNGLRLWDLSGGRRTGEGPYMPLAVRPDGKRVLGWAERGELVMIDPRTHRARATGVTFSSPAEAAWSPDGRTIAIARGGARGIRLYDADR